MPKPVSIDIPGCQPEKRHYRQMSSLRWIDDDRLVAGVGELIPGNNKLKEGMVFSLSTASVTATCPMPGWSSWLCRDAVSPAKTLVASGGGSHTQPEVVVWELDSGKRHCVLTGIAHYLGALAFVDESNLLVAAKGGVALYRLPTGERLQEFPLPPSSKKLAAFSPQALSVALSADKSLVAAGALEGAYVWEIKSGALVMEVKHSNKVRYVHLTKDKLISAALARQIEVKRTQLLGKKSEKVAFTEHKGDVGGLYVSPDHKIAISGSTEFGPMRIWDFQTGSQIGSWDLPCLGGFSPDGKRLAGNSHYALSVVEFDVDSMSSSLEERAEDNDVKAQWKLAVCYRDGLWPVKTKDIGQAVEWYKRAAANGSANAMLELGNCYDAGNGIGKDEALAAHWYRQGAELGNIHCRANFGEYCEYGKGGLPVDFEQALSYYSKALEQGLGAVGPALDRVKAELAKRQPLSR